MKQIKLLNERQIAEAWLKITLEELPKAQDAAGVKQYSGAMHRPIGHIFGDAQTVSLVRIIMPLHTRFVDMGVGRGFKVGSKGDLGESVFALSRNEKGQLHRVNRKPKNVWNKPLTHQVRRLSELVLENLGRSTIQIMESGLKSDIDIKL